MRYEVRVTGLDLDLTTMEEEVYETQVISVDNCTATRIFVGDDEPADEVVCGNPVQAHKTAKLWETELRATYKQNRREWDAQVLAEEKAQRDELADEVEGLLTGGAWADMVGERKLLKLVAAAIRDNRVSDTLDKLNQ